jgi:hypothetical protein
MSSVAGLEFDDDQPIALRRFSESKIWKYLRSGHRSVEGWLTPMSARIIAALLEDQARICVKGSVGEIGVHHGKLFLVAYLSLRENEHAFAIDVFENQDLNIDHSGKGDRAQFLGNLHRHAGSTDALTLIAENSLGILPDRILEEIGAARFISVDGGHTEECTRNDLLLAEACLVQGGIIVLDDYFNPHWPDVSVGAAAHALSGKATTKPFLITPNKIYFADSRYHEGYKKAVRAKFGRHYSRSGQMFESSVDIYALQGLGDLPSTVFQLIRDEVRMRTAPFPRAKLFIKNTLNRR